jgi:hypothetical protein
MIKDTVQYVAGEGFRDTEDLFPTDTDMHTFMADASEDEPEVDLIYSVKVYKHPKWQGGVILIDIDAMGVWFPWIVCKTAADYVTFWADVIARIPAKVQETP